MTRKRFIELIEQHGVILERLLARVQQFPSQKLGYNRQQLFILCDLAMSGRSKLKEIAHRQCIPTPNLCIMFRKLEAEGLVARNVDENDRRNTWYSVTGKGQKIAIKFKDSAMDMIEHFCRNLSTAEEVKLTESLECINKILTRVEEQNA